MCSQQYTHTRSGFFCLTLFLLLSFGMSAQASQFELVTPAEYEQALEKGENPLNDLVPKSVSNGPTIKVVAPSVSQGKLSSPVDIKVEFKASDNASIDMSTLKIYYLMFIKKDVTSRILEHATLNEDSISATGAKLPEGTHKFLVEIMDSDKRKSSQKFTVEVET